MSTFRQRGLEYAKSVSAARDSRKSNQPNVFGRKPTDSGTPAFIQNARGEVDNIADETKPLRDEEKGIRNDGDKDDVDHKAFKPGPVTGKTIPSGKVSTNTDSTNELKSSLEKCWTSVDHINIPQIYHDDKSSWTSNAIVLFELLNDMEELLNGNEELRWKAPNYFSLPVRVYYAVLFYVQVLRAKNEAGTITKSESSWLRAFFRRFKETMLPVAGPLVPYFMNIVSVLPDDNQFDYVHPTCPSKGSYEVELADKKQRMIVYGHHALVPSVALIASLLKFYCTHQRLQDENFDEEGNFVPFRLSEGGEFAGFTFPANAGGDATIAALLTNPVLMHPLPENKDRLLEIHGFWKRSKAKNIPHIPTNLPYLPNGPSGWTLLNDDYDWFQPCVDAAHIQCAFFSDAGNLSEIPTVGGVSALVVSRIRPDNSTERPTQVNTWYPNKYSSLKATFKATSAELGLDSVYEAAFALTNATLSWQIDRKEIGSMDGLLRAGPYFENTKTTYELESEVSVNTQGYTMIQTQFYDSHGKGGKS
jgi:hypothetical protein